MRKRNPDSYLIYNRVGTNADYIQSAGIIFFNFCRKISNVYGKVTEVTVLKRATWSVTIGAVCISITAPGGNHPHTVKACGNIARYSDVKIIVIIFMIELLRGAKVKNNQAV